MMRSLSPPSLLRATSRSSALTRRTATFHSKPSCSLKNSRKAGSSESAGKDLAGEGAYEEDDGEAEDNDDDGDDDDEEEEEDDDNDDDNDNGDDDESKEEEESSTAWRDR